MGQNATIFMKGGFGNQLFQIAFAHYLKLNNYKVNINLDFFVDDGRQFQPTVYLAAGRAAHPPGIPP